MSVIEYDGWRASVTTDPLRRMARITLGRLHGDSIDVLLNDGRTLRTVDVNATFDDDVGLLIPIEAWAAIVAAVEPQVAERERQLYGEALAIERARVDRILERLAPL